MGQGDIYKFLKANPDQWFISREISNRIDISLVSVTMSLKKLRENNEVEFKKSGKKKGSRDQYLYKFKL